MITEQYFDDQPEPLWCISDEAWQRILPILIEDCPPRKGPGRKPADWRRVLNGILYRLRTGCHWNKLPKEFGDDSTIHRWYQRWNKHCVLSRVLSELHGEWQETEPAGQQLDHSSPAHAPIENAMLEHAGCQHAD